jgi:hypothetical protein
MDMAIWRAPDAVVSAVYGAACSKWDAAIYSLQQAYEGFWGEGC